ncbi:TfoX/Sxy family protein [Pseudooceanicola sp. CBS1P-1]|uniref:Competence protein TfoX n=1 Tax=Pseudooceanicola albus TaxID=2692189 RepID=A0A6L7G2L0_9RHOB|nr:MULTISPECIES: TfoX/Sxy family DNA transformation protein [Pseudooceanicola]MBT9383833.1 TfoX/Sxy family protein [Pseudooceanicola endophyticus]MXN17687.1 competence protein TfoX [Pseudooceanicola albus]
MTAIRSIRNLGPALEEAFHAAGITSAEALRALGADAGYEAVVRAGRRPHVMAFIALVTGLQDRPWNSCDKAERALLRTRYEAVLERARSAGPKGDALPADLSAFLERHGIRAVG